MLKAIELSDLDVSLLHKDSFVYSFRNGIYKFHLSNTKKETQHKLYLY